MSKQRRENECSNAELECGCEGLLAIGVTLWVARAHLLVWPSTRNISVFPFPFRYHSRRLLEATTGAHHSSSLPASLCLLYTGNRR
jgi:hypothetical protein